VSKIASEAPSRSIAKENGLALYENLRAEALALTPLEEGRGNTELGT